MGWLVFGILYAAGYAVAGMLLKSQPSVLGVFRAVALFVPPLTGVAVIVLRRHRWRGCQWLFWSTIGLGLVMSALGLTGWAADELVFRHRVWLAWPAVFALFGGVAPLFALLAQPHRGAREPLAATTAVDIAGLAVVTGFLYSFFVTAPSSAGAANHPLLALSELQQGLAAFGLMAATFAARGTPWRATYRRLATGAIVSFAMITIANIGAGLGLYRTASVYDLTWILPFAFYPWAASLAPATEDVESPALESQDGLTRPRPWIIFGAVAMIPFVDFGLRHLGLIETSAFRDLSTAVTFVSVLPLLVARIAAERAELRQADGTMRLLTQVIEQTQDHILVLTPDGRIRHANLAFCRAVGLSREELMATEAGDAFARQIVSADEVQTTMSRGDTWRGTLIRARRDGTTFPVSASVATLTDGSGRATHMVSVERDISEERRLKDQLIQTERLSAVGELIAGVAHELNNPLQSVMGFTDLLLRNEQRPEVRSDLEHVRMDADRAAKTVRNLLTFVRRSALERSMVDLSDIARSAIAARARELQAAHITVQANLADDLPLTFGSHEEIRQVILNLLSNAEGAIRETEKPGAIRVRTGRSGSTLFAEVADTGPGVPADFAGRIFEPFFTTKDVGEGPGLGLSIGLGLARAHGGSLTLMTRSHPGACFRLQLPIASNVTTQCSTAELVGAGAGGR